MCCGQNVGLLAMPHNCTHYNIVSIHLPKSLLSAREVSNCHYNKQKKTHTYESQGSKLVGGDDGLKGESAFASIGMVSYLQIHQQMKH